MRDAQQIGSTGTCHSCLGLLERSHGLSDLRFERRGLGHSLGDLRLQQREAL